MPVDSGRFLTRAYRSGDENAILDLFGRSFHAPRTLEQWRWKFQDDPYGRERISLTFDGPALVAHYAGYPVPFVMRDGDVVAHQIGDTMTDASVRHIGRGPSSILGQTALHFYERFCEGKVAFNYGFNVANIQKFSLRFLRSDRVEPVTYRVRDLRMKPLPPMRKLERWARGISLDLVQSVSAEWDALFARVGPQYLFLGRRDSTYVTWRYLQCPDPKYTVVSMRKWGKLVGWIVLRIREGRLSLGDMLIDPDHADALEAALRHLTPLFPASLVEAWCPPRPSWLDRYLREIGFETRPEPQDLSVMCVPFMRNDAVEAMRSELFYTMGDSDLF